MKYNIPKYTIGHPFGVDIENNLRSIKNIVKDFLSIASSDLKKTKNLTLVCMGSSGAIVSTIFCLGLQSKYKHINVSICHVKKQGEESHGDRISGFQTTSNTMYVWVDDFIESAETLNACHSLIKEYCYNKGINFNNDIFKFDYVVCSTIINVKKVKNLTENIIYNYL